MWIFSYSMCLCIVIRLLYYVNVIISESVSKIQILHKKHKKRQKCERNANTTIFIYESEYVSKIQISC